MLIIRGEIIVKWVNSLTGRFMLYSALVLLLLMGAVYAYQAKLIQEDAEQQLLDKGQGLTIAMSKSLQTIAESDIQTGVTLKNGTKLAGDDVKKRLFDDKLQLIPESQQEADKRLKDATYGAAKQLLFNGKEVTLAQFELKYTSAYDAYTDDRWQGVIDSFLTDSSVVFAVPVAYSQNPDFTGFVPTHNMKFSPTGDDSKDQWGAVGLLSQKYRANRVFNNDTGAAAAANTDTGKALLQKYPMIVEGNTVDTYDISYPILIGGQHWGAARISFSKAATDAMIARQQRNFAIELALVFVGILALMYILSGITVARKLRLMLRGTANLNSQEADLTYRIPIRGKDEMGLLAAEINQFIAHLQEMIGSMRKLSVRVTGHSQQLADGAEQSLTASGQMTRAVQEVAAGAQTQAGSAEESAKAMEEMAVGIQRIAESSGNVAEASQTMVEEAQHGNGTSAEAAQQMHSLSNSAQEVEVAMGDLQQRMTDVGQMAAVISGIASQTSLLALNAAIEAARAGEQGRGFAIVAGEVRKLADQAEESAARIRDQVEGVQDSMASAVNAISVAGQGVEQGMAGVQKVQSSFERIVNMARNVSGQIQEISAASEQMSAGTEEVTAGIEEMAQIASSAKDQSEQAASLSEQQMEMADRTAEMAEALRLVAEELGQTVQRFRV